MKSFLNKRRKSITGPPPSSRQYGSDAPPVPSFARNQAPGGNTMMLNANPVMEMPDLRFSKLDLDIDLGNIRGSVLQSDEKRKSKLAFLGFSNTKAVQSSEELQVSRLGMIPGKAASTTSLADHMKRSSESPSSTSYNSLPRSLSRAPEEDRRKLVASATEAMNLHVPVKAPLKQQSGRQTVPSQANKQPSTKLTSPLSQDVNKSKKDLKKEEKERVTREKEHAKEAAKEVKEAAKREKELTRRMSKGDIKNGSAKQLKAAPSPSLPVATAMMEKNARSSSSTRNAGDSNSYPARPEQRRALESTTNIHSSSVVPSSRPLPTSSSSNSSSKPRSSSKNRGGSPPGGRPPSAPPSHKPPPAPISGTKKPSSSASTRPQSKSNSEQRESSIDVRPFQFPKAAPVPHATRSQSAMPAADGVPRPVASRGKTQAPERGSSNVNNDQSKTGMYGNFGGPLTNSPPQQSIATLGTPQSQKSSNRSMQTKQTRASSSDGYGTSSTVDAATSTESNTSYEDSPLSHNDDQDHFVDASQNFPPRIRPRRDEEREERAQSRLSMTLDSELAGEQESDDYEHTRNDSKDSKKRFSQLLMGSRPGGAADRAAARAAAAAQADDESVAVKSNFEAQRQHYLSNGKVFSARPAPPPPEPVKRSREAAPVAKRRVVVRPEMVVEGDGWKCHGVGDVEVPNVHERFVMEKILVAKVVEPEEKGEEEEEEKEEESDAEDPSLESKPKEPIIEYQEEEIKVRYNDLFELLWTSTTPDVISRFVSHLDLADLKTLRQTSHSIRFTLNVNDNREMILNKFLSSIGYRSWTYVKSSTPSYRNGVRVATSNTTRDPCPLSFNDCEAFLLSQDLLPEYGAVGKEFARMPEQMDPRMARLAQASTRAYSRVLTRLRLQPVFKISSPQSTTADKSPTRLQRGEDSSFGLSATTPSTMEVSGTMTKHNSYYPLAKSNPSSPLESSTHFASPISGSLLLDTTKLPSPMSEGGLVTSSFPSPSSLTASPTMINSPSLEANNAPPMMTSPWKPGRAAFYRVWVPASDPNGWLTDEELSQCESELFKAGIWNFLKKGDVVWDTAVGDYMNEGKYIFDGHYLRDLSYAHDVAGHLPSWLNCVMYSPSYWHNIIKSSSPRPIIYFDVSPWKDQILNSLRLVQDHVESYSNSGSRYRVAKWLYRSAANITSGQIISKMSGGLEIVDDGWGGRIVIETEGTAEHAKSLISRCAGPNATPQAKAALLATVMGDVTAANKMMNTSDTNGLTRPINFTRSGGDQPNAEVQNSAWMIMRERSRPGLIWIKLA